MQELELFLLCAIIGVSQKNSENQVLGVLFMFSAQQQRFTRRTHSTGF